MECLQRPSADQAQLDFYLATRDHNHPETLAEIHLSLRPLRHYYMHELARALWQLVDKGTLAVHGGRIKNIEEF